MPNQESHSDLSGEISDTHRALKSLKHELGAVDWCNQCVDVCNDPMMCAIAYNRDVDEENAAMILERRQRNDAGSNNELTYYLFIEKPIAHD